MRRLQFLGPGRAGPGRLDAVEAEEPARQAGADAPAVAATPRRTR